MKIGELWQDKKDKSYIRITDINSEHNWISYEPRVQLKDGEGWIEGCYIKDFLKDNRRVD